MSSLNSLPPDIEIARNTKLKPIQDIAKKIHVPLEYIETYGKYKAKISLDYLPTLNEVPNGKLILVSSITPTPAGEGKTTTTIGIGDALNRIGKKTIICLREPSLGPCFGIKGGATGGGYSQVAPMEDINLHFTGDFHAIGAAHNLLAAVVDNHLHHGNTLRIDPRRILWNRVMDMSDRALRDIIIGLGGTGNSIPRETSFDITVASEVMAIFCLSESIEELRNRLGKIIVGYNYEKEPVTAHDLKAEGAMAALLKDAIKPNLVQTLEHNPALIHGGPFANIAHGCNSLIATKMALKLADYTVTEAGFGADLGAEKFLDIKCRKGNIHPDVVVLVATLRAIKHNGGGELKELAIPNMKTLEAGLENLKKHVENIHHFGLPVVVAINSFPSDTPEEIAFVKEKCAYMGVHMVESKHWEQGSKGAEQLARILVEVCETTATDFHFLYPDHLTLWKKVDTIAKEIYGAVGIMADKKLRSKFESLQQQGYGQLPVCIAKTQYSLSTDPGLKGRPSDFHIPLRDIRLAAGAGFVVVLAGEIMTMPGLPIEPAAEKIDLNENGDITGLF